MIISCEIAISQVRYTFCFLEEIHIWEKNKTLEKLSKLIMSKFQHVFSFPKNICFSAYVIFEENTFPRFECSCGFFHFTSEINIWFTYITLFFFNFRLWSLSLAESCTYKIMLIKSNNIIRNELQIIQKLVSYQNDVLLQKFMSHGISYCDIPQKWELKLRLTINFKLYVGEGEVRNFFWEIVLFSQFD